MAAPPSNVPPPPDVNNGPEILIVTLVVTILAIVTTTLRGYVRIAKITSFGIDDYVMFLATAVIVTGQGIIIGEVHYGAGRHVQYLKPAFISRGLYLNFITQPLYVWASTLIKLSVGLFLLRIAAKPSYSRGIIIALMAFMTLYAISSIFSSVRMLAARDASRAGISPSFTDLLFALFIPVTLLCGVQMHYKTKIGVIAILGLGVFACIACIVKITYIAAYGKMGDFLFDSTNLTIWNVVECCVGIMAANLPCLKPLFRSVFGTTYGSNSPSPPWKGSTSHSAPDKHGSVGTTVQHQESVHQLENGLRNESNEKHVVAGYNAE